MHDKYATVAEMSSHCPESVQRFKRIHIGMQFDSCISKDVIQ